jgi:hypothetical protein
MPKNNIVTLSNRYAAVAIAPRHRVTKSYTSLTGEVPQSLSTQLREITRRVRGQRDFGNQINGSEVEFDLAWQLHKRTAEGEEMKTKIIIVMVLSAALLNATTLTLLAQMPTQGKEVQSLAHLVSKSYLDLLEIAAALPFSASEIEAYKQSLEREKEAEKKRLEQEEKSLKAQIEQARQQLAALNKRASRDTKDMAAERNQWQCRIYKLERDLTEKKAAREHGLPLTYDNKKAKLELLQQWPTKQKEIADIIASGRARQRPHGDVEDIGLRKVGEGQEKDIKLGQDAINDMKMYGLMPPEVEDKALNAYVRQLADTLAINSDLKVPLKVMLLDSDEINAFALPGGFLFINTGLIEKADNESELVGVMAHELAHVTTRHGARLMKRATIAGIIYEAAQIAAMIFTGGVVGIGMYYALQYGFFGLGLVLNLALLGVSREFEAEADQLGVQYAWRAGYEPQGFITFFDKMASEKGYVKSASFFRTHPPFFDRIVSTFSEIAYLPTTEGLQIDSTAFRQAKESLKKWKQEHEKEQKKRPTLRRLPQCDDEVTKQEVTPLAAIR